MSATVYKIPRLHEPSLLMSPFRLNQTITVLTVLLSAVTLESASIFGGQYGGQYSTGLITYCPPNLKLKRTVRTVRTVLEVMGNGYKYAL